MIRYYVNASTSLRSFQRVPPAPTGRHDGAHRAPQIIRVPWQRGLVDQVQIPSLLFFVTSSSSLALGAPTLANSRGSLFLLLFLVLGSHVDWHVGHCVIIY